MKEFYEAGNIACMELSLRRTRVQLNTSQQNDFKNLYSKVQKPEVCDATGDEKCCHCAFHTLRPCSG